MVGEETALWGAKMASRFLTAEEGGFSNHEKMVDKKHEEVKGSFEARWLCGLPPCCYSQLHRLLVIPLGYNL